MIDIKELTNFSKTLKVLYIEDNKDVRDSVILMLKNLFNDITVGVNGVDGFNKFQTVKYDLIITDINMPQMNGIEMLKRIREINIDIPCIIISAHTESNYLLDAIKLGSDGFILKPIDTAQFMHTISKTLYKLKIEAELKNSNTNLQKKVTDAVSNLEVKDKILLQSTKMALVGEMVDSVAHQWQQPLTIIKMKLQMLDEDLKIGNINSKDIKNTIINGENQINHLTNTINEFRSFFRPITNIKSISINEIITNTILLMKDDLIKNCIDTQIQGDLESNINVNKNEFIHVFINIINNAKDAFIENNITNRVIIFAVKKNKDKVKLTITDNAGGIPNNIINQIFEPGFTTKEDQGGTGIGLYMTKQIIHKNKATVDIRTFDYKTSFIIDFNNYIHDAIDEDIIVNNWTEI